MGEALRLLLLLALAGGAATGLVAAAAWAMAEPRRLARAFRHVLAEPPETVLIAKGRGQGAAISFAAGQMAVAWDGGAWCLVYGLHEVLGAELIVDGVVAARVMRDEPRRLLERTGGAETEARLRLLFDDPRHPDFDMLLWPPPRPTPRSPTAAATLAEANRWLARIETLLRRQPAQAPQRPAAIASHSPRRPAPSPAILPDQQDFFEDEDGEEGEEEAGDIVV